MGKKAPLLSSSFKYREQDPSFYGQQLDQRYSSGPIPQRKCTDLFCCLLILILIGGMGFVGYLGFKNGKPYLLVAPFDEDGKQCGIDLGYENHQKIFISIRNDDPTDVGFVCVKQCPISQNSTLDCIPNPQAPTCDILKIYEAKTVVNLCYPSAQVFDLFNFDEFMDISVLQEYFADLNDGWPLLAGCVGFSFVISMVFTVFIRFCAGCFVWVSILAFWVLMMGIATASFFINDLKFLQDLIHYNDLPDNLKNRDYQITCAVICWILSFLIFIIVCCFQRQIRISIGILKASADFTRELCYAFLIPIYVTIMQVLFLAVWLTAILYIFSSADKIEPFAHTPFAFVQFDTTMQLYSILYLFGLLWIIFFLQAIGDYWICSTVALWYYEKGEPKSPICRSIGRSFKQLGSLAFGSLIIAFVVFLRMLLEYFTRMLKQQTLGIDQQVGPAKYALKCASCYIACFERVVRFLTRNAYIMMAISGKGFCQSASQSFYLVIKSTAQFSICHGTTKIFIVFSKFMIVAICCVCGYLALTQIQYYRTIIYSPVFLTILFGLVSYPVASAFLNLFEMASNTILMCYCIQYDLMNGSNPKCPPALRNFLREYVNQSVASSQIR